MAQWARAPATKLDDLSFIPMTHVVERMDLCRFSFVPPTPKHTHRKIKYNF